MGPLPMSLPPLLSPLLVPSVMPLPPLLLLLDTPPPLLLPTLDLPLPPSVPLLTTKLKKTMKNSNSQHDLTQGCARCPKRLDLFNHHHLFFVSVQKAHFSTC